MTMRFASTLSVGNFVALTVTIETETALSFTLSKEAKTTCLAHSVRGKSSAHYYKNKSVFNRSKGMVRHYFRRHHCHIADLTQIPRLGLFAQGATHTSLTLWQRR